MASDGIFSSMQTTVTGLSSQLKRLETIAENISNAQSGPDASGRIYHKKRVIDAPLNGAQPGSFQHQMSISLKRANPSHFSSITSIQGKALGSPAPQFRVEEVGGEVIEHDPTNPLADENGYVRKPDINVVEEVSGMISASRAYEANISVLQAAKAIAKLTMEI